MDQPTIDQTARALAGVRASGTESDVNRFLCAVERHYGTEHMRDAHKLAGETAEWQHRRTDSKGLSLPDWGLFAGERDGYVYVRTVGDVLWRRPLLDPPLYVPWERATDHSRECFQMTEG